MSKTFQPKKPPLPCSSPPPHNNLIPILTSSYTNLITKYTSFPYQNDYIQTNYLIFNEKCRSVALFKDYLVYDDNTEFLKRYYTYNELTPKLKTIFAFYETYSRIFPNYMILPESEYLYRNIRKKQKMIDAFNQIKKEEEENRKHLNINNSGKRNGNGMMQSYKKNIVFDKQVRKSINKCEPSEIKNNYINNKVYGYNKDDSGNGGDSISISLVSRKQMYNGNNNNNNMFNTPSCSFANEDNSFASIALIIQGMDRNVVQLETPKRKNNNNINYNVNNKVSTPHNKCNSDDTNEFDEFDEHSHHHIQSALNNNRKFISHKSTASVPDMNNNSIKIINNYHKIIIPQGTTNAVININAHIYQCDNNNNINNNNNVNALSPSSTANVKDNIHTHSNTQLSNASLIVNSNHIKSNTAIKGFQTNMLTHNNNKSLSKSKNYSMQKNNTNSYLNTQSNNNNNNHHHKGATITTSSTTATTNKCFNINTKSLSKKKYSHHHSSNNKLNEYKAESPITSSAFKSPEKILSLSKKKNITTTVTTTNHIMPIYKNKHFSNIQTLSALQNNKVNPFKSKFQRKKTIQKHNTNNSVSVNKDKNTKAKQEHVVVCKSNEDNNGNMIMVTHENNKHHNSIEVNNRNSVNSQRKPVNLKTPLVKKVIMSPKNANVGGYVMSLVERSKVPLTEKVKLIQKCPLNREMIKSKGIFGNITNSNAGGPSKIIKGFNMKGVDSNTKKMKFLKK